MPPSTTPPASPPSAIARAAPRGTGKILAPSASRQRSPPITGYAAAPTDENNNNKKTPNTNKKKKKKTQQLLIDFGVKPPSADEKLYSGDQSDGEPPPPAVDTSKEEALAGAFDEDGVEARLAGMSIATVRPRAPGDFYKSPKVGVSVMVDETAGLGRDGKI